MAGKGSKRRPGDEKKYRDNWEEIFRNNNNNGGTKTKSDGRKKA
ncbi:MAG: hypothetical protein WC082_11785 [Victivallales bacterium]